MPVNEVVQTDCNPKKVFVLGVYASAVHACWIDIYGKTVVNALAVASEPQIFWRGEDVDTILEEISIPNELGKLIPAQKEFNGPSGIALDSLILNPLGLARKEAWLCDLVPHSCVNPSQKKAIERSYTPLISKFGLPDPSVPSLPKPLIEQSRRDKIIHEIKESKASVLILLGDLPVQWFLSSFDYRWSKLSDFGRDLQSYGTLHDTFIDRMKIRILPIAHPRQIARLGKSSAFWFEAHNNWIKHKAVELAKAI